MASPSPGSPKRLMPFIVAATILTLVNLFEVYLKIGDGTGGPIWVNLLYAAVAFTAIVRRLPRPEAGAGRVGEPFGNPGEPP